MATLSQAQLVSLISSYDSQLAVAATTRASLLSTGDTSTVAIIDNQIQEISRLRQDAVTQLQNLNVTNPYVEQFTPTQVNGLSAPEPTTNPSLLSNVTQNPSGIGTSGTGTGTTGTGTSGTGTGTTGTGAAGTNGTSSPANVNEPTSQTSTNNDTAQVQNGPAVPVQGTPYYGALDAARVSAINNVITGASKNIDWRVKLELAEHANYLFKMQTGENQGILLPLAATGGIIFPYTPAIQVSYAARYDPLELVHSNYKIFQYKNSAVEQVQITCDFTAQDTFEANYVLAVIHFLRAATKMFYGQDEDPRPGYPPPLCYLTGLGAYQFDKHPLVIAGFNYALPTDVDYIRASSFYGAIGDPGAPGDPGKGGLPINGQSSDIEPTYVPTKIQIQISALPIVSRQDISRNFSFKDYASGKLLRATSARLIPGGGGGGMW